MTEEMRKERLLYMKQLSKPVKRALRSFLVMMVSLVISYLVMHFIIKSDNFWITILIASILTSVFDGVLKYRQSVKGTK